MSDMQAKQDGASDISLYNIMGDLGGLGRSILSYGVHEMRDGDDVRAFLCSSRRVQEIMLDKQFGWSIARVLSETYSLSSVPLELTDIVCFLLSLPLYYNSFLI